MRGYKNVYGCDTETDNDGRRAWIVQWAIHDGIRAVTGDSAGSLMNTMLAYLKNNKRNYFYFHNLNYDIQFLRAELAAVAQDPAFEVSIIKRQSAMISVTISIRNRRGSVIIRDSAKKIPGTLKKLGETVGLKKLDGFEFVAGWSYHVDFSKSENWDYVIRDAEIVAVAMQRLHRLGDTASTSSGDAWRAIKRYAANDKSYSDNFKWLDRYPKLNIELDSLFRKGYSGGINISRFRCRHSGKLTHCDVHSMYPGVMYNDRLPYGLPTRTTTPPPEGVLYICTFTARMKLKNGLFPWFRFPNGLDSQMENLDPAEPVTETEYFHDFVMTNVDLALIQEWYDLEISEEFEPVFYIFASDDDFFKGYIDHWYTIKEESAKGSIEYLAAKAKMNQMYGRFALNPNADETFMLYDKDLGDWNFKQITVTNEDNDAYLPVAMFVTAYARTRLLEGCMKVIEAGEEVIHCDTDSIIHTGEPLETMNYSNNLGDWGLESRPCAVYEGGFKRYIEFLTEEPKRVKDFSVACAGVPQRTDDNGVPYGMWVELLDDPSIITRHEELGKEDYRIKSEWLRQLYLDHGKDPDAVNTYKLIPVKVPGGVILEERTHKLNDNLVWRRGN